MKTEENMQNFQHIMLYYFKKGKNATETHTKKMCAVHGEGAVTDRTCQKWFAKFCAGGFSPDDAPQSGRPVEVDSDQIETLIENDQHSTMWEIVDILKISNQYSPLLVKMKNVSFVLQNKLNRLLASPMV